jgi:hypothetical protein
VGRAPKQIGGANIVLFTTIDERHRHTGECLQIVAGVVQGPAAGLAICLYDGEDGFHLFGCDEDWLCVTDTWHQTLEQATGQAEFEFACRNRRSGSRCCQDAIRPRD